LWEAESGPYIVACYGFELHRCIVNHSCVYAEFTASLIRNRLPVSLAKGVRWIKWKKEIGNTSCE
jgi:hypothetical protein